MIWQLPSLSCPTTYKLAPFASLYPNSPTLLSLTHSPAAGNLPARNELNAGEGNGRTYIQRGTTLEIVIDAYTTQVRDFTEYEFKKSDHA